MDLRRTAGSVTLAATPSPDTILFNGKIFTSDGKQFVEALAIQGDRIEAVGDSKQIHKLAGSFNEANRSGRPHCHSWP
jgi:hypothetical protein